MPSVFRKRLILTLISVENLMVCYGAKTVLNQINLSVDSGEIVTIVGPNGSGKTTLFRAIIGTTPYNIGSIKVKPGLRIGYVPQRLHLDPTLPITVERFMRLIHSMETDSFFSVLETLGISNLLNTQMAQLSGGQFQRVLLARALINRPDILLLDEATQGLDQSGAALFYRQIEDILRDFGCAVLMISHDLHVVMSASDRVICLNGHVCCAGTPAVVASAPEYQALFGSETEGALALYRHEHDHGHDHNEAPHGATK